jgi:tetratricopeptide (TPR) repeat protein
MADYRKLFQEQESSFIKTDQKLPITSVQKVALNRKGNILFNEGNIEEAKRIFLTTGYSDGLSRIGDYYKSQGKVLDALRMYWKAPDRNKAETIIVQLSAVIKDLIAN